MLPMTAMPIAPPVWRVVSLTAEPTPALPSGSEPMIDSVAGAVVSPTPTPSSNLTAAPATNDDMTVFDAYSSIAAEVMTIPVTTTRLVPQRNTNRGAFGAATIIPIATGIAISPDFRGEYPSTNWKYCVRMNVEPNTANVTSVTVTDAAENRGFSKKRRSSIGSRVWSSHAAKRPPHSMPTAKPIRTLVAVHPASG